MIAWMQEILDKFLQVVLSLFPLSPFLPVIQAIGDLPYLGYINWFIPVRELVSIGTLWIIAIGAYYAWMVIARWVKLIT